MPLVGAVTREISFSRLHLEGHVVQGQEGFALPELPRADLPRGVFLPMNARMEPLQLVPQRRPADLAEAVLLGYMIYCYHVSQHIHLFQ